jgi:hypothetical protein
MYDMCDTREICEARKSRSSRGYRASSRDLCMRDVWGAPRPEALRAWRRVTLRVITQTASNQLVSRLGRVIRLLARLSE